MLRSDHVHDHSHDGEDHYDEDTMAFDPTLASCCERDQMEFDKAMKLKAVLTAHDPTSGAVRLRQQLFQPPPSVAIAPKTHQQVENPPVADSDSDLDSDFDDSDEEFGMEAMLAVRRKQLELQVQQAAQNAIDGYGIVMDKELQQLVQDLQAEPEVPRVALVVDTELSTMRSEMTAVAQRFIGTKFYMVKPDDDASRQLRLASVPSLTAFRGGERVDSIALDAKTLMTEANVLWEARFLPWLTKCNVLTSERQNSQNNQRKVSRKNSAKEEEEPSGFDCGVEGCRLRFGYEHEHVGTSQEFKDEIATWRQTPTERDV
ncbi:hypothetical protein BBO99_00004258 [Phytophthora kernoviae]|uniref:Thioredoxin domain-containing protein n=2 Tax=Phytophthora kernoviae TaxID=325452 RepID=A0A421EZB5_9STRA|nr:hypothetical protein G195_006386 [Phytophthora kernoviae 00238/432]KAG2524724.1 hypothetical protein JM18_005270 [Phytophthora kernoviae]RLN10785.1 hypothetical protein BBI17_004402 [Phytophthora kernoviae]RLN80771.1 hypothetical protein BBO99_00004258 [Phytophthora kernoviae]